MSKNKVFALRVNKEVMEALEKCAADEFRSANRQLEWMIAKVLMEEGRLKIKSPSDDEKENSKS